LKNSILKSKEVVMNEILIGTVSDYFARIGVAGIDLTGPLKVGDRIRIEGHTTELDFIVSSMQIDCQEVSEAQAGDSVGISVPERARKGDKVYKIV
jgi:translation elongation factor EF-Tu-like GTPase